MILNIRLHMKGATLSSMTLKVLSLVQGTSWKLFGISSKRGLPQLSLRISYMQFGIHVFAFQMKLLI